jgi:ribosomal protein S8E
LEKYERNTKILVKASIDHYQRKRHKQCIDEECSKSLDQKKQSMVNPNRMNGDNLKIKRCVTRRVGTKNEYLESEINEFAMNSKKKIVRLK